MTTATTTKIGTNLNCQISYTAQKTKQVKTITHVKIFCGDMLIASRNVNGKALEKWCMLDFKANPSRYTKEEGWDFYASWNNKF